MNVSMKLRLAHSTSTEPAETNSYILMHKMKWKESLTIAMSLYFVLINFYYYTGESQLSCDKILTKSYVQFTLKLCSEISTCCWCSQVFNIWKYFSFRSKIHYYFGLKFNTNQRRITIFALQFKYVREWPWYLGKSENFEINWIFITLAPKYLIRNWFLFTQKRIRSLHQHCFVCLPWKKSSQEEKERFF